MAGAKLFSSCNMAGAKLFTSLLLLVLPWCAEASWWHDPYVLANYSLLDPSVKKILPEKDFRPLAAFFAANPTAARLFGETPALRHRLQSTPRSVSEVGGHDIFVNFVLWGFAKLFRFTWRNKML
jgi:hypothetical protein